MTTTRTTRTTRTSDEDEGEGRTARPVEREDETGARVRGEGMNARVRACGGMGAVVVRVSIHGVIQTSLWVREGETRGRDARDDEGRER